MPASRAFSATAAGHAHAPPIARLPPPAPAHGRRPGERCRVVCAPSAMRTAISRPRCATLNDSRPWMPTPARTTAMAAKAPSTRTCTSRGAVSLSTMSASSRTFETGCSGSARARISRIAGTSVAAADRRLHHEILRHVERHPAVGALRRRHVAPAVRSGARGRAPSRRRRRRRSCARGRRRRSAGRSPPGSPGTYCRTNDSLTTATFGRVAACRSPRRRGRRAAECRRSRRTAA